MQSQVPRLPYVVNAISAERQQEMQRRVAMVWHRFLYSSNPLFPKALQSAIANYKAWHPGDRLTSADASIPAAVHDALGKDDAFSSVLQWLYHRINATR